MVVIVEFAVPSRAFKFGTMLSLGPDTEVNVEQLVPVGDNVMPFSWVSGDIEGFEEGLEEAEIPYAVVVEDDGRDRRLYRLEWDAGDDELIQAILGSDGAVLSALGTRDEWSFQVRFEGRERLSEFHRRCEDSEVPLSVVRIYNPIDISGKLRSGMTATQMETLLDAFEAGYFKVPRETTLVELSEKYGISDQAVSERLRRGIGELVESGLVASRVGEGDEDDEGDETDDAVSVGKAKKD